MWIESVLLDRFLDYFHLSHLQILQIRTPTSSCIFYSDVAFSVCLGCLLSTSPMSNTYYKFYCEVDFSLCLSYRLFIYLQRQQKVIEAHVAKFTVHVLIWPTTLLQYSVRMLLISTFFVLLTLLTNITKFETFVNQVRIIEDKNYSCYAQQ